MTGCTASVAGVVLTADQRWAAWQARGQVQDRIVRDRWVTAGNLAGVALVLAFGTFIGLL